MAETFVVKCPDCDQPHRVGDQHRGKRIKCRGCEKVIAVPAGDSTGEHSKAVPPKRAAKKQVSSGENPYAAFEEDEGGASGDVSDAVVEELRKTKPWVRLVGFLGVIGIILSAVAVAIGSLGLVMGPRGFGGPGLISIIIQIVALVLYFLAAKFLIGYSRSIGRLEESGDTEDLVAALAEQRRFWLLQGILIIVAVGIGLILALFMIATQLI